MVPGHSVDPGGLDRRLQGDALAPLTRVLSGCGTPLASLERLGIKPGHDIAIQVRVMIETSEWSEFESCSPCPVVCL